jgi:hypothetical protein
VRRDALARSHHVQVEREAAVGLLVDEVARLALAFLGRRELGSGPELAPGREGDQPIQDACQRVTVVDAVLSNVPNAT